MPRSAAVKKPLDTREQRGAPDRNATIALEGAATLEVDPIEVIDGPRFKDREAELVFMEEPVTIMIHPSQDPKPEDPVYVAVNGRGCYIWRNQKTIVRRKYVERLARAKTQTVRQDITAKEPEQLNRLTLSSSLRYPFQVLSDPHPMGGAWLQKILQEG